MREAGKVADNQEEVEDEEGMNAPPPPRQNENTAPAGERPRRGSGLLRRRARNRAYQDEKQGERRQGNVEAAPKPPRGGKAARPQGRGNGPLGGNVAPRAKGPRKTRTMKPRGASSIMRDTHLREPDEHRMPQRSTRTVTVVVKKPRRKIETPPEES
jgi:hypothetical protein